MWEQVKAEDVNLILQHQFASALERIGFVLCTILFLVGLLTVLGRYGWLVAATASVGMTAGSDVIFTTLLKLHLPSGPLGF